MLGEVEEEQLQNDIAEEHRRHGDILQATFMDTYRNLTYKHVLGYRYVPRAGFTQPRTIV